MNIKENLLFLRLAIKIPNPHVSDLFKIAILNFTKNYVKQPDLRSFWFVFCVFVDPLWPATIFSGDSMYNLTSSLN